VVWTDRFINGSPQNSISAVVAQPWGTQGPDLSLIGPTGSAASITSAFPATTIPVQPNAEDTLKGARDRATLLYHGIRREGLYDLLLLVARFLREAG
jgi:hypothetical protein